MSALGYCRVSTSVQADHGQSLEVQQRQLQAFATLHDLTLGHVYIDRAISGSKPLAERPAGAQLLEAAKDGDAIIATRLDRMFRSALDALGVLDSLRARSVSLYLIDLGGDVTGDGIAKLVFTILSAVAEAERDRIRERIRDVKRDQRRRGRFLGGSRPFGWSRGADDVLVPVAREQCALRTMHEMREEGASLRAISAAMRANGTPLSHQGVERALSGDRAG